MSFTGVALVAAVAGVAGLADILSLPVFGELLLLLLQAAKTDAPMVAAKIKCLIVLILMMLQYTGEVQYDK